MDREISIGKSGDLMVTAGPGTGKPVLCCHAARLCYSHCAAFGMTAGNVALGAAPSLHCNAVGDGVRIGYLETVTP